jgi:DNA-binding MarR family transcriptional regulator
MARDVWRHISQLFISYQDERERVASELGLNGTDLITLFHLQPDGAVAQRDLAEHWACDPSWITARIDRLEQLGLVERRPGVSDRRIKMVSLTNAGEKVREAGIEGFAKPPDVLLELTSQELRDVAAALGRLPIPSPDEMVQHRIKRTPA